MKIAGLLERVDGFKLKYGNAEQHSDLHKGQKAETELTRGMIDETVQKLNKASESFRERITFSFHEKTNRVVLKVKNNETDEVVREIPVRDLIKLAEHIQEYLGMFVDESR